MARVKRGVTTHARHKKVLELAKVEQMPRMEGRQMTMVISPK